MPIETYLQYIGRTQGLPDFVPLNQSEFEAHQQYTQANLEQIAQGANHKPQPINRTALELEHLAVLAVEAEQSTMFRSPEHSETVRQGFSATEEQQRVRGSHEELFRAIEAEEQESRRAEAERQRKLDKELADSEHRLEMAAKALEAERYQRRAIADESTKDLGTRHGAN
jgi:formate dehydrogenase assembly factor FdhD